MYISVAVSTSYPLEEMTLLETVVMTVVVMTTARHNNEENGFIFIIIYLNFLIE